MSKTHVEATALRDFLNAVAKRNGWKELSDRPAMIVPGGAGIHFAVMGSVKTPVGDYIPMNIDLLLARPEGFTGYYVVSFWIRQLATFTDPEKALTHLGKGMRENQFEVGRPADLEALFRAYDFVALLNGTPTVFNLP